MTSSDPSTILIVENELLEVAALVLRDAGCRLRAHRLGDGQEFLLAENAYYIICVVASTSARDILDVERRLADELTTLSLRSDVGPKRWDLYLVILAPRDPEDSKELARDLYRITYDTQHLRRIAVLDVEPTLESLRDALRSFLPTLAPDTAQPLGDALTELESALAEQGIDPANAARAVAAFRSSRSLDDV